jgi:rod shape-determining protein MreC
MYRQYHELKGKNRQLKFENYLLRTRQKQLGFETKVKKKQEDFIGAELIFVDSNIPYDCVMINKGSSSGINKDMVVLNENGDLVGRVIDPITMFSSRVRLITSRIGGVGSYIKKNRLEGFLAGNNQKYCSFKYLLENAPVKIGDEVITSGTDQLFPPYIPVGRVVKIKKEYLIQNVQVKPFFLEKSIKQLIIMKNSKKSSEK